MKNWAEDHPKAKLMAKKRASIIAAARSAFLSFGYEKASMEAIAAEAQVSVMTLYRHVRTKDDLFEAIVSEACYPAEGTDDARAAKAILEKPLVEILAFIATRFRNRLMRPEVLGLLRAVMIERERFPHLGDMAFEGLIASHVRQMIAFISSRPEAERVSEARRAQLSAAFFDALVGTDQIRVLLGLPLDGEERAHSIPNRAAQAFVDELARG